jgi:hypothetical protein
VRGGSRTGVRSCVREKGREMGGELGGVMGVGRRWREGESKLVGVSLARGGPG